MTDSDEVKLLPCPFCGGEPISFASGAGDGLMIQCINDKCGVEPHCSYIPPEAAIAAWNTRPPVVTDEVVERVARVNAAYHEALRRYPDAQGALVFFWAASGLGAVEPTAEHIEWAKSVIASMPAKAPPIF